LVIASVALAISATASHIWFWLLCSSSPLSFAEADLDHDGYVSYAEADYVSDLGTRQVSLQGRQCTEFFTQKDGLPLKVVCPGAAVAERPAGPLK
jgi:hypothetical protein